MTDDAGKASNLIVVVHPTHAQGSKGREKVAAQRAAAALARAEAARRAGADPVDLQRDASGCPLETDGWFWSQTHDDTWAAAVVARSPVGVDLERIAPRRDALVARVLREDERTQLEPDALGLTRAWTAKEAVLKATTIGLSGLSRCRIVRRDDAEVPRLRVELDGELWIVSQRIDDTHVLAVTVRDQSPRVDWLRLPTREG